MLARRLVQPYASAAPRGTRTSGGDGAAAAEPSTGPAPLLHAAVQMLQLSAALAGLILLPAHVSGRLAAEGGRAAASFCCYLLFFARGTIRRMMRHGALAPAQQDAQRSRGGLALLLFAGVAVPAGHFLAWLLPLPSSCVAAAPVLAWALPAVGYALMLAGWELNAAAAAVLGKDFDRLVAPSRLVTTGPYAWVQHPIYSSYMLLFVGHCLSLGSPAAAAFLLAACVGYYRVRTRLEEAILFQAFGQEYKRYQMATGRFVPRPGTRQQS